MTSMKSLGHLYCVCCMASQLIACSTPSIHRPSADGLAPVPELHSIYINKFGDLVSRLPGDRARQAASPTIEDCAAEAAPADRIQCEEKYVQLIINNFKLENAKQIQSGKPPLALTLYIHGGLNTISDATVRPSRFSADMLNDGQYPLFISWDSAGPTNYIDHLLRVRQGENKPLIGLLTSPLVLLEDISRAIVRIPVATYRSFADPLTVTKTVFDNTEQNYQARIDKISDIFSVSNPEPYTGVGPSYATVWNPIKLVTAPLIDGLGTGAWDSMLRRTDLVLSRSDAYQDVSPQKKDYSGQSAATRFIQAWTQNPDTKDVKVNLIGHSMGTIVANNIIARHPTLKIENIVFMGAAARIKDVENIVAPFLKAPHHQNAAFYNLSLDPYREIGEDFYLDIAPRGSLLHWIDNIFGEVNSFKDRTAGSWWNMVRIAADILPHTKRVHLTRFPIGGTEMGPQKHGEFDEYCFWRQSFWDGTGRPLQRHPACATSDVPNLVAPPAPITTYQN